MFYKKKIRNSETQSTGLDSGSKQGQYFSRPADSQGTQTYILPIILKKIFFAHQATQIYHCVDLIHVKPV